MESGAYPVFPENRECRASAASKASKASRECRGSRECQDRVVLRGQQEALLVQRTTSPSKSPFASTRKGPLRFGLAFTSDLREVSGLEEMWPDEDRRDAALTRLLIRIHTGVDWERNERNEQRDIGTAAYLAAKAWLRIKHRIR